MRDVIPDLPTANYQVWVRGYGLVDLPKMRAKPGQQLNLAVPAPYRPTRQTRGLYKGGSTS